MRDVRRGWNGLDRVARPLRRLRKRAASAAEQTCKCDQQKERVAHSRNQQHLSPVPSDKCDNGRAWVTANILVSTNWIAIVRAPGVSRRPALRLVPALSLPTPPP